MKKRRERCRGGKEEKKREKSVEIQVVGVHSV
jgi:hypothetical protein